MHPVKAPYFFRTCRLSDEDDLVEICHLTGDTRIDPYLLALRWCLDYLWHETETCFVAENLETGKVVGYIVGTRNTRQQEDRLVQVMKPRIIAYWRTLKPKTAAQWRGYLSILTSFRNPARGLISEYPAHLHINVHPKYQRAGLGSQLLKIFEQHLIRNSIQGYHLGVSGENQLGIGFYQKQGMTRLGQFPQLGKPYVIFFGRQLESLR